MERNGKRENKREKMERKQGTTEKRKKTGGKKTSDPPFAKSRLAEPMVYVCALHRGASLSYKELGLRNSITKAMPRASTTQELSRTGIKTQEKKQRGRKREGRREGGKEGRREGGREGGKEGGKEGGLVAHDCGYPLSRYTCRATRVAADFLDFRAFCRCSTGVALHPLKILVSHLPPVV